jgi:hypothetical protein
MLMRYHELTEATATEALQQRTFYHGTASDDLAQSILQTGIVPGNTTGKSLGHLTPVTGRSYLTSDLRYAVIYCIGGDMLGSTSDYLLNKGVRDGKPSRYGWLFVISGKQFVADIQPDEDSVGAFLMDHTESGWDQSTKPWRRLAPTYKPDGVEDNHKRMVWHNIRHGMTDMQFRNAVDGLIAAQAAGGKRALKRLSDADKLALIRWGAHVAYQGPLIPEQAWRFDKKKVSQLVKDGSNFFELAERIR